MKERIKAVRKKIGLTQTEFGARIGVKGNTITNYETGLRVPSEAVILSICREFGIKRKWLLDGEGEMFLEPSNNVLDALAVKYGLSNSARALVEEFVNLPPDIQQAFVDYAIKAARAIANDEDPTTLPDSSTELTNEQTAEPEEHDIEAEPDLPIPEGSTPEIEAELARIREEMILEKSMKTSLESTPASAG